MQPNCCSVWNLPSWEECLRPALQFVDILKHPGGHRQTKSNYEWLTAAHSFFLSVSRRRTSHRKSEFLFHTLSAYLPVSKWQWLKPASLPQWLFGITLNAVHPSPVCASSHIRSVPVHDVSLHGSPPLTGTATALRCSVLHLTAPGQWLHPRARSVWEDRRTTYTQSALGSGYAFSQVAQTNARTAGSTGHVFSSVHDQLHFWLKTYQVPNVKFTLCALILNFTYLDWVVDCSQTQILSLKKIQ